MKYWTEASLASRIFLKRELFIDGKRKLHCPTVGTKFNPEAGLADCYGQDFSPVVLDDCQNPYIATPILADFRKQGKLPDKQLIPVNQMPGGATGDSRFFCCYNYAIAENDEQVRTCNMPSRAVLDKHCKLGAESDPKIKKYIDDLKRIRVSIPPDVLTLPFTDPRRIMWTECICDRNLAVCGRI